MDNEFEEILPDIGSIQKGKIDLNDEVWIEQLAGLIRKKIDFYLKNSTEKLFQIFYRLDIEEKKVQEAFSRFNGVELADQLSRIVLEREIKRLKTRLKYATPKND